MEPNNTDGGQEFTYIAELSKSGRAECRVCNEKIENRSLRIGVLTHTRWGVFSRWQHLNCTVFKPSVPQQGHGDISSWSDEAWRASLQIDGLENLSQEDREAVERKALQSKTEADESDKPLNPDDLVRKTWSDPAEPPEDLLMPLLPFQKEGLGWMLHQEASDMRGGILADEMGMGMSSVCYALLV